MSVPIGCCGTPFQGLAVPLVPLVPLQINMTFVQHDFPMIFYQATDGEHDRVTSMFFSQYCKPCKRDKILVRSMLRLGDLRGN